MCVMLTSIQITELAGYTSRVWHMFEVFDDVGKGNYERAESDANLPPLLQIKG